MDEIELWEKILTLWGPLAIGYIAAVFLWKELKAERKENKDEMRKIYNEQLERRDQDIMLKTSLVTHLKNLHTSVDALISK